MISRKERKERKERKGRKERKEGKKKKKPRKNEDSALSRLNTLKMIKINMAVLASKQIQKTKNLRTPQNFTEACIEKSTNRGQIL